MGKEEILEKLRMEAEEADLLLKETATNIVFGKGNAEAEILFVGEAPGANEDIQGMPFVGAAGKNLDKLLEKVGLSMNDVYITNILKYRPPENRAPSVEEIKMHTPWLVKQIQLMKPKIICSLGNYATKFFLANGNADEMDGQPGITGIHGKVHEIDFNGLKIKLIPLFHPAAIIYNRALIGEWEKDMEIVKREIRKDLFMEMKDTITIDEAIENSKKRWGE